jgi:type I restriction enzyme R subunit
MIGPEADARTVIDQQLERAGWAGDQVRREYLTATGPADYVLFANGQAIAVVEAKRAARLAELGLDQAARYARDLGVHFIYAANSRRILFQDLRRGVFRELPAFHSPGDLRRFLDRFRVIDTSKRDPRSLSTSAWLLDDPRGEINAQAVRALEEAIMGGRRRMFVEMATGIGKTELAASLVEHLLQSRQVERVLFLVDRDQLAKQAVDRFTERLPDYNVRRILGGIIPSDGEIFVATLQTLATANRAGVPLYLNCESSFFDLVVSDESHRSIYGDWRPILDHFDAIQIGLTATPALFRDRNTFEFFSEGGDPAPIFKFSYQEAVAAGLLVPYRIVQVTTEVTKLAREGKFRYLGEDYSVGDIERKINVPERNREIIEAYLREIGGHFRKTIVFAVTVRHAYELERLLNDAVTRPHRDFAKVIVGESSEAKSLIQDFVTQEYPKVAVSVEMLTTGFDAPKVEHLVMARPTRSPILYQQMKGRACRPCPEIGKREFVVFDFVGNAEHFRDFEWEDFGEWKPTAMRGEREAEQRESWEIVEAHDVPDRVVQLVIFGPEYDELPALDYRGAFEAKIQEAKETFPPVAKLARGEPLTPEEEEELRAWLDSPEHYYTEETLREAYEEPGAELADFVDVALGKRRFLPKDQRIRQAFESWCRQKRLNEEQRGVLDVFTEQYIANEGWKLPEPPAPNFNVPPLADRGGLDYAKRVFGDVRNLRAIIDDLREGVLRTAA